MGLKVNIIACGETGALWDGEGYSIGVNDCWKFGKKTNELVIVNSPARFDRDRLDVIIRSKPDIFHSHLMGWKLHFPKMNEIRLKQFHGKVRKGDIYSSKTSPLIAMSMAFNMGATEIVLWGVDFQTHRTYYKDHKRTLLELRQYDLFSQEVEKQGCKVYHGYESK